MLVDQVTGAGLNSEAFVGAEVGTDPAGELALVLDGLVLTFADAQR